METVTFYSVKWITTQEFGTTLVPFVFFDGEATTSVNQWFYKLIKEGVAATKLETSIRAIGHLYNFYKVWSTLHGEDFNPERLIADFIDAKKYGTDQYCISTSKPLLKSLFLDWKPVREDNIRKTYLNHINDFDKWQSLFHGADRLNPSEERFLSDYESYLDFKDRSGWDMLLHLSPSRSKTKEEFKVSMQNRSGARAAKLQNRIKKCFPVDRFIEAIESLSSPRDKLLFLLYGAGSLRRSEPLHIFFEDVLGVDSLGQLEVRLADPVYGRFDWVDVDGRSRQTTRAEYIMQQFKNTHLPKSHPLKDLVPRDRHLNRDSQYYAGFKGMTFGDDLITHDEQTVDSTVFWCSPELGKYAAKVFNEYAQNFIYKNPYTGKPNPAGWPYHPWLFIKLKESDYGIPLTIGSIKSTLRRLLKKMGLKGYGLHSFRHLFGFYVANVLGLPSSTLQAMLHHGDPSSTQIYYHLSNQKVRNEILLANNVDPKRAKELMFDLNANFQYQYPKNWSE